MSARALSAITQHGDGVALVCEELYVPLCALTGAHVAAAAVAIDSRLQPHPEVERHVRSAQPKRRAEFAAGRWCAGAAPIRGIDLIDLAEKRDIESLHGLFIAPGDEIAACPRAGRRERLAALLSGKEATIKILSSRCGTTIDPRQMHVRRDSAGFYLRHPEFPFAIGYDASVVEDVLLTIARIAPDRGRDDA